MKVTPLPSALFPWMMWHIIGKTGSSAVASTTHIWRGVFA